VTLESERLGELRRRLSAWANDRLTPADLVPRLRIDSPLGLRDISQDVIAGLVQLGPYGPMNPKPVFRASGIDLVDVPRKLKDRHLALTVKQHGRAFRAIAWRAADREEYLTTHRFGLDLAYSLEESEYRGERFTELTVADVRAAGEAAS
jgi:single-stranded-DNA-specific exonuclease